MSLRVDIDKRDLDKLARNFKTTARVHADRELDKAMLDAGDAVGHGIRDAKDIFMPRGYEQVFSKSLVIESKLRKLGGIRKVTLTGRAFGRKGNPRQVEELEKGRIKHPVYGRKVWVWQKIRPGWFTVPAKFATPAAVRKLDKAAERIGKHLTDGL